MKGKKEHGVCPRCLGTGRSRAFNRHPKYSEATRRRAVALWDKGWSLRRIAESMKLPHPQTVKNLLCGTPKAKAVTHG